MNTSTIPLQTNSNTKSENESSSRHDAIGLTWKRLLWKEWKQLMPLFLTLIGIGVLLHILGLLPNGFDQPTFHSVVMVLIPGLLAVGVGPMLVSQEKELKTLAWMGSLPVSRQTVVGSKFAVGLGALLVCWLINWIIALAICPQILSSPDYQDVRAILWPINSLFLLIVSFALAWICPTAMSTLVTLLVIAAIPTMLDSVLASSFPELLGRGASSMPTLASSMLSYLMVGVILAITAVRYGRSSFVAGGAKNAWVEWWNQLDFRYYAATRSLPQSQGMVASLLWQIATQNRMLIVTAASIVILPCFAWLVFQSFTNASHTTGFHEEIAFVAILGCVILSWLGTSVFGSDGTKQRIRFLADRGVSPGSVWWTRQILPIGLMIVMLACWFGIVMYLTSLEDPTQYPRQVPNVPWIAVLLSFTAVYAASQWSTQWMKSSLVVFCVAPAIGLIAVGLGAFALSALGAPTWLVCVSIALAFVASRVMMGAWMDGRFGLEYYLSHGGFLSAALLIPAIPFLITYCSYPDMPATVKRALSDEAKTFENGSYPKKVQPSAFELVLSPKELPEEELATTFDNEGVLIPDPRREEVIKKMPSVEASVSSTLDFVESQLASHGGPLKGPPFALQFVHREASLASLRLDSDSTSDTKNETTSKRYQRAIGLLHSIVERLRMSPRIIEQEYADRLEAWLVHELSKPTRRETLGTELYSKCVRSLANNESRNQSRRQAIAVSWSNFAKSGLAADMGGIPVPNACTATARFETCSSPATSS
jgi:ABC-type transport system involved in multi-copper enzyme maturation permease subunit